MYKGLMAQPKETAWLVATGSLTNVGLLLKRFPDVTAHLKGISIMGGSFGDGFTDCPPNIVDGEVRVGNIGLWAEFNILIDPEAAAAVFHNKEVAKKTTLIPLDVSHLVLATKEVREMILYGPGAKPEREGKSTLRKMLVELLGFFAGTYAYVYNSSSLLSCGTLRREAQRWPLPQLHQQHTSLTAVQKRVRRQERCSIARPHRSCRTAHRHRRRNPVHGMA
jgi:inosine-uridine nucleoside N-ribohydrolase